MSEKIIYVDRIGQVTFRKNKRSKKISITLRPIKGIIVNMPGYVSYKFARKVVEKKREWILKNVPKIEKIENKATVFDENTNFTTRYRKLYIHEKNINKIQSIIKSDKIEIFYPQHIKSNHNQLQQIIRETIVNALRLEAKQYLPERTRYLANKYKFEFNRIFIKNAKTLWGSCSARNNINLNLHLLRLPDYLIDYVIIHELCHTIEKNHRKNFWALMDTILMDAKKLSKELKTYSIQIY